MADPLTHALAAARRAPATELALAPRVGALVIGAGGAIGSALLAEALVAGRFLRVQALVAGPLASALRGFEPLHEETLARPGTLGIDTAFVVFERERHSNGRDEAFVRPAPEALLPLARTLHARGVKRLVVVVPHAPALLPQALKAGFASLAEGAVASLGFEQLVFVRAAQAAGREPLASRIDGFVRWWFSQLRWMVPQREAPLTAPVLAARIVQLARTLPGSPIGTRVLSHDALPPEDAPR